MKHRMLLGLLALLPLTANAGTMRCKSALQIRVALDWNYVQRPVPCWGKKWGWNAGFGS